MRLESENDKEEQVQRLNRVESKVAYAALSDKGIERVVNEDRCAQFRTASAECFLVLDGMGGADGGEFAAQLSQDSIEKSLTGEHGEPMTALRSALEEANRTIVLRRQGRKFGEMGTTVVAALIEGSNVVIAHVGDSRAYVVREEGIEQLTVDHTFVQQLVDRNEISKEEALPHPQSHVLTQCLGSSPEVRVDCRQLWVWPQQPECSTDYLVLCSDGLYSMIHDDELAAVVMTLPPQDACAELVRLANHRGGYDNITVSIIPLNGHLREEVSPTFGREVKKRAQEQKRRRWWGKSIVFHLMLAGFGGFVATWIGLAALLFFKVR